MRPVPLPAQPGDPALLLRWCVDRIADISRASQVDTPVDAASDNAGLYQPLDDTLTALAALVLAADKLIYATGPDAFATTDLSPAARTLIAQTTQALMRTTGLGMSANGSSLVSAADYAAMRILLSLVVGTNVQAFHANLTQLANLALIADRLPYADGAGTLALATFTAAGRAILDDADAPAQRATLSAEELGTLRAINTQTGNYTLVLGDAGQTVEMNVAGANTLTVPPNSSVAFPVKTYMNFVQYGAGQTTLTPGSGVTLQNQSGLKTAGQYAMATLYKRATDEWVVGGNLTA